MRVDARGPQIVRTEKQQRGPGWLVSRLVSKTGNPEEGQSDYSAHFCIVRSISKTPPVNTKPKWWLACWPKTIFWVELGLCLSCRASSSIANIFAWNTLAYHRRPCDSVTVMRIREYRRFDTIGVL